jgi:hypothetical protein
MKASDITDVRVSHNVYEIKINANVVWQRPPDFGAPVLAMEDDAEVVTENGKHTLRVV